MPDIKIIEAASVKEIIALLQDVPSSATIFLDIDETIIAPASSSFRTRDKKDFIEDMKASRENYPNLPDILSNWRLKRKIMLTDDDWPSATEDLKKRHQVYGLTQMDPGKFGRIESMEKWRLEELRELGIIFTHNEVAQNFKINTELDINPIFYHGILFTGRASKGETIRLFDAILSVEFVVLVDDRIDHLQNVEVFCRKKGIGFLGIHFKGAEYLSGTYDPELAEFQKLNLIENGTWFEDDEARGGLKKTVAVRL